MIYCDKTTRVLVQGATGNQGAFHIDLMNRYAREVGGAGVVAGVTPGKGGRDIHGVPVYDTVREAQAAHDTGASVIFVPAGAAADSIMEAADAGIETIVAITEHIPVHDVMRAVAYAGSCGSIVIGPNCPGLLSPGECKLGIMPSPLFTRGPVGVISRSGTLTYEVVDELTRAGIGQSTVVGIGGDPVIGETFVNCVEEFSEDPYTKAVILIGEVGGALEIDGAEAALSLDLPLIAYIAGISAPKEKRMGHAGAIIEGGEGDAASKIKRLQSLGITVATRPSELPKFIAGLI